MRSWLDIAEQFTAAFKALNADGFGALYADDVVVWHNVDMQTQTKAENLTSVAAILSNALSASYDSIVRTRTDVGFVQQHIVNLQLKDGRRIPPIAACLVFRIENGLISRLDEYLDPTAAIQAMSAQSPV
jgi:limonene-1,2-epoxide hydrolase